MLYRIQFVLVFFLFLFFCNKVSLFPIEHVNEKWGFIDKKGKFVIDPKFDWAIGFSEGLAPVKVDGKWSYNDNTEKVVIEPKFDYSNENTEREFKKFYNFTLTNWSSVYEPIWISTISYSERYEVERNLAIMVKRNKSFLLSSSFSAAEAYIQLYTANRNIDEIAYWSTKRYNQVEHLLTNSTTLTQKIAGTNAGLFFGWGSENIKKLRDIQSDLNATLDLLKGFKINKAKRQYIYACGVVDGEERRFYDEVDLFKKAKSIAIWLDRGIIFILMVLLIFLFRTVYFRWKRKNEKNEDEKLLRDILS